LRQAADKLFDAQLVEPFPNDRLAKRERLYATLPGLLKLVAGAFARASVILSATSRKQTGGRDWHSDC
jgi:hypothetical protein